MTAIEYRVGSGPLGPIGIGMRDTCRARVLEAIDVLERRHQREVFRLDEIIREASKVGNIYTLSTIRATIMSSMCVEARAGRRAVYADLERVRRGEYRRLRRQRSG